MVAPLVVFDLDGTLVDTAPDLVETLNVIFTRQGLPPVPYAAARNMVGGGARVMLERGLAAEGRTVPAAELYRLMAAFIEY
jgi:phosphoglycolate phosphatase